MIEMKLTRRDFIKSNAVAAAATVAGISVPGATLAQQKASDGVRWDKGVCRFCGTGCGVLVGVKDGRVVATQGDPDAPVNRGLNCIKGYFLSKIMYGKDRLTTADAAHEERQVRQERRVHADHLDAGLRHHGREVQGRAQGRRAAQFGMFGSGQWTIWEGYAAAKLLKAGFRSNNLDPNARHCMASAVAGFMRTFGIDEPMGCYDDVEHADAFVLWGSNMAEMHPILWSRITDRRLSAKHVKVHVLSTFEHRSCELADNALIFKPQSDLAILNYICNHIIQTGAVNKDFVAKARQVRQGRHRHRLRPAPEASAGKGGDEQRLPGRRGQAEGQPEQLDADHLRRVRRVRLRIHAGQGERDFRRAEGKPRGAGQGLRRSEDQGDLATGPWASTSTPAAPG